MTSPVVHRAEAHELVERLVVEQEVLDAAYAIADTRAGELMVAKRLLDDARLAVEAAEDVVSDTRAALSRAVGSQWGLAS